MLNKKPSGPQVMVRMFYDREEVFVFCGTDDDGHLSGLSGNAFAIKVARELIRQIMEDRKSFPDADKVEAAFAKTLK